MSKTTYSSEEMQRYFNDPEYRRQRAKRSRNWSLRRSIWVFGGIAVGVTLGEVCDVYRDEFGVYRARNSEEMLDKLVYLTGVAVKLERKRMLDIVQGELDTWVGDYKRIVKVLCDNITDTVKYGDDK